MTDLLRLYLDPDEIGPDGYPYAWHGKIQPHRSGDMIGALADAFAAAQVLGDQSQSIKEYVREQAGYRCERCGHSYPPGITETCPRGEWTPCDEQCTHGGEIRYRDLALNSDWREMNLHAPVGQTLDDEYPEGPRRRWETQAHWRILTTHHLNGIKHDCTWGNLVALCQRCHLTIQGKVWMDRVYDRPHTEWFRPYAAFHYARVYLGEELSRDEVNERMDELLALELRQERLPGV